MPGLEDELKRSIEEIQIKKIFWLGFQLLLPIMIVFIELAARINSDFGVIDFVKTQKPILVVVIIYLNLIAGIYLDERRLKVSDVELNLLKTKSFILYTISSLFLISMYLILIRLGNSNEINDNLYLIVSILIYLAAYSIAYISFYSLMNSTIQKYNEMLTLNKVRM